MRRGRAGGTGYFYPPTVLTGITPEMRIHTEEAFGPVATLYRVADIDEAIELANATEFGLGPTPGPRTPTSGPASCATSRPAWCSSTATPPPTTSCPFGGIKTSGYGRELTAHGIREFCNLKSVWVGA